MTNLTEAVSEEKNSKWLPIGMSLATHALLVVALLFLFSNLPHSESDQRNRPGEIVLAVVADDSDIEYFEEANISSSASVPNRVAELVDRAPPEIPEMRSKPIDLAGMTPIDAATDSTQMAETGSNSVPNLQYELTKDDLEMIDADRKLLKSREPTGPKTTISVFGSGALTGRKFVFLIDRSKSMGDQGLSVLRHARTELFNAINQLEPHHLFQIVGYHDRTVTIARRQLLPATTENKQLVPGFMRNLLAFGGTNHQNAIYAALAFRPDVIVILNDGGFPELHDGQINTISKSAQGETQIHALHFGPGPPQDADHFMKRLAEKCSGTYRYINVRNWRQQQDTVKQP